MQPSVLKITLSGQPQAWISLEQAAWHLAGDRVAWAFGDIVTTLRGGWNHRLGHRSTLDIPAIIAVRGDPLQNLGEVALTRRNLFARDRYTCLYCGEALSEGRLTHDHILPRSRGGRDTFVNSATACRPCNHRKGARTPEEAGMPLLAVPYAPNRFEYLYLRNRAILADQAAYLSRGFRHLVA